jgi:hypothetical protein
MKQRYGVAPDGVVAALAAPPSRAGRPLPALVGSHMVLQRDAPPAFRLAAPAGESA